MRGKIYIRHGSRARPGFRTESARPPLWLVMAWTRARSLGREPGGGEVDGEVLGTVGERGRRPESAPVQEPEKLIDLIWGVVEMRRDSKAARAPCDMDARCLQTRQNDLVLFGVCMG